MEDRTIDTREPSVEAYIAGLNAASERWKLEAVEILSSNELNNGAFLNEDSTIKFGVITTPGSGDYDGWKLSGYHTLHSRDGFYLEAPASKNEETGPIVGYIVQNDGGSWTACHDSFNNQPGITVGSSGSRVSLPSQEDAIRYIAVSRARHLAQYGR